jgi:hypothetical protein
MQPQTITIDDPVEWLLFEKVRAGLAEVRRAGDQAGYGQVFHAVDAAALAFARSMARETCQVVLQDQVDRVEKKGQRSGTAPVASDVRTPAPRRGE